MCYHLATMDIQLVVIIGAIVALLTLFVYLMSVFGTKEKTYEEVLEEQRKKQQELFGKSATEGDKKKDKKQKKPKKPKTSGDKQATGDAGQQEEEPEEPVKMLNLELEPEVIEPDTHAKSSGVRKRKSNKPILHNRDEKSPVSSELEVEEKFHPRQAPKDDVEVKHERERRMSGTRSTDDEQPPQPVSKPSKKNKKAKEVAAVKPEPVVVEEVIQAQAAPVVAAEPPRKSGKKGKNSPPPATKKGRPFFWYIFYK